MGFIFRPFMMLATGNFRGLFSLLLSLALLGGLWELSLVNLSSRQTAVSLMTDIGVEFINPVLTANSLGIAQGAYTTLEKSAAAHPTQPLNIPGIKVQVLGSEIAGKSFADGTHAIYGDVAKAYYDGGSGAVFAVPAQVGDVIGALGLLPQVVAGQAAKQAGVPSLPSVPLPPLAGLGLSLALLTAKGHAQAVMLAQYFWAAAGILMLLVALLSHRWARLSTPAWALFSSAVPGLIGIGIIWYAWGRDAAAFTPYANILHDIGGAFIPVYVGAAAIGLAVVLFAAIARPIFKHRGGQKPHEPEHGPPHVRTDVSTGREWANVPDTGAGRAPRPGGNGGSGFGGSPPGASGYGASGYGGSGYSGSGYGASRYGTPGYGGSSAGGGFGGAGGGFGPDQSSRGGSYGGPPAYGQGSADPYPGSERPPFTGSAGQPSGAPSGPMIQRPPAWGGSDAGAGAWPPPSSSGQRPPEWGRTGQGGFGQGGGYGPGGPGNQPPSWPPRQDDADAWPPRR